MASENVTVEGRIVAASGPLSAPGLDLDTYVVGPEGRGVIGHLFIVYGAGGPVWLNDLPTGTPVSVTGPLNVRQESIQALTAVKLGSVNNAGAVAVFYDKAPIPAMSGERNSGLGADTLLVNTGVPGSAVDWGTGSEPTGADPMPGESVGGPQAECGGSTGANPYGGGPTEPGGGPEASDPVVQGEAGGSGDPVTTIEGDPDLTTEHETQAAAAAKRNKIMLGLGAAALAIFALSRRG